MDSVLNPAKKFCRRCKLEKVVELFGPDKKSSDGLKTYCNACNVELQRQYRKENPTLISESRKRYRLKNLAYIKEKQKKYKRGYIEKRREEMRKKKKRAMEYMKWMKKSKKIKSQPCMLCGKNKNIHGHHINYDFPKKVIWLCPSHHRTFHTTWKFIPDYERKN